VVLKCDEVCVIIGFCSRCVPSGIDVWLGLFHARFCSRCVLIDFNFWLGLCHPRFN